jgi:rhodanese-related sulfurtransferase
MRGRKEKQLSVVLVHPCRVRSGTIETMAKPKPTPKKQTPIDLPPVPPNSVVNITAEELLPVASRVKILDCRSASERRLGAILGFVEYNPNTFEFENRKSIPIVCVSWIEKRSLVAAYRLAKQGYTVYNLSGGMFNWFRKGYPRVRG